MVIEPYSHLIDTVAGAVQYLTDKCSSSCNSTSHYKTLRFSATTPHPKVILHDCWHLSSKQWFEMLISCCWRVSVRAVQVMCHQLEASSGLKPPLLVDSQFVSVTRCASWQMLITIWMSSSGYSYCIHLHILDSMFCDMGIFHLLEHLLLLYQSCELVIFFTCILFCFSISLTVILFLYIATKSTWWRVQYLLYVIYVSPGYLLVLLC